MRTGRKVVYVGCTKCDNKHYSKGMCKMHYTRELRRKQAILSYQKVGVVCR